MSGHAACVTSRARCVITQLCARAEDVVPRLLGGPQAAPRDAEAAPMQPTAPPARAGDAAPVVPLRLPAPWRHGAARAANGAPRRDAPAGAGQGGAGARGDDAGAAESGGDGGAGAGGEAGGAGAAAPAASEPAAALAAAAAAKAGGRLHLAHFYTQRARRALFRGHGADGARRLRPQASLWRCAERRRQAACRSSSRRAGSMQWVSMQ